MTARGARIAKRAVDGRAYRLVPSRFPTVGPWDRIASPDDFAALAQIEGLTNPRILEELGVLSTIPRERRVSGPGTTPVMAAFTHLNPEGSRFSDGTYGVFYAAREIETAIRETVFHRERFLARTSEPPLQVQMRCYSSSVRTELDDIRGGHPDLHDADSYAASQSFGRDQRAGNSSGIVYDSVRRAGGQCVAVFWPDVVGPCTQGKHYAYCWDGRIISSVLELSAVDF